MPRYKVTRIAYYRYEHTGEYEAKDESDARAQASDYAASCDFWDYTKELTPADRVYSMIDEGTTVTPL